jgi:hypothetical protein
MMTRSPFFSFVSVKGICATAAASDATRAQAASAVPASLPGSDRINIEASCRDGDEAV